MDYRVKYQIEKAIDALQKALQYSQESFKVDEVDNSPYSMYYGTQVTSLKIK